VYAQEDASEAEAEESENVDAVGEGGAWLASDDEAERQQPEEEGSEKCQNRKGIDS
jgi:hypothetical protein